MVIIYSVPSSSAHSQLRPPSLIWPDSFAITTMIPVSLSPEATCLMWLHFHGKWVDLIREGCHEGKISNRKV